MPDSLSVSYSSDTLTQSGTAASILSQGIVGPPGPAGAEGGGEVAVPEFPIVDPQFVSSLAAGASANLDSVIIAANKIGKLQQITLSSSAACKWMIQKMTDGASTTLDIVFTSGFSGHAPTHEWEPPHKDYAELIGDGTTTFFRVMVVNLEGAFPVNCYCTYMFDEVDA
jgi:hypothetical protein